MSLWVLGTDTGVGKTVVSALVLSRYRAAGPLAYWKPISTGGDHDRDRLAIERWMGDEVDILPESYCLAAPESPHLAARLDGVVIDPERILGDLDVHRFADASRSLVVEGAGGVLVPLGDEGPLSADLVAASALPVLVVARSTLGTINHTLLTLEALRSRRVEVRGVVLDGPPHLENRRAIERLGCVPVIDRVAPLDGAWSGERLSSLQLSAADIRRAAERFDPQGALADLFGGASP